MIYIINDIFFIGRPTFGLACEIKEDCAKQKLLHSGGTYLGCWLVKSLVNVHFL